MFKPLKITLFFCILFSLSQVIPAATYTVTKTADTADGACDADCSLREAVTAAGASAEDDTIQFSALFNTPQTITLSLSDIIINSGGTLVINGPGAMLLTVSGNNLSRVFTNNPGAVTTISKLLVTQGTGTSTIQTLRGGGIYNNGGNLTISEVVVKGNSTTNGGGISNAGSGTFNVINSTIEDNTVSGSGGGAQNFSGSTMNIIGSTFYSNVAGSSGTGGGGLQANGTVNIANSTFSGNKAANASGGGIYYNGAALTMNNVTITANISLNSGGGFNRGTSNGVPVFRNTIISGNTSTNGVPDVAGAISSLGNNLIGVVGASTGWIASDLLERPAFLAPLANNGGPTQTHALLPSSLAINGGQNCVTNLSCASGNPPQALTTDQRGSGFPRQVSAAVDIGAFESNFAFRSQTAPFDFDADGRSDYATFRPSNAAWFIQRSTSGFFAQQFGQANDLLAPADYDGDGKADIAVWRETGNAQPGFSNFYILRSSNNTFQSEQFGTTGDNPRIVGDWDGDGKADVAVFRPNDPVNVPCIPGASIWFYRPSSAPGVDFRYMCWGLPGDEPVSGDFDGDGLKDHAVFRPSDSIWYILQSSNGLHRYERWGVASDKRIPADYDGDGKTDLAVFRGGVWSILQSSNNQERYEVWGNASDRFITGDYDGDGKFDLAVWRNGDFLVLRSSDNQNVSYSFGAAGDIPVASAYLAP